MKKHLNNTRGETIVEVVVAFVLLLLFISVFTTALRYAQKVNAQADALREAAFQLSEELYPLNKGNTPNNENKMNQGDPVTGSTQDYIFRFKGLSFTVESVQLYCNHAEANPTTDAGTTTHSYDFYSYGDGKGGTNP